MKTVPFRARVRDYPFPDLLIDLEAYETETPGLVVHGQIDPDSREPAKRGKWIVSHAASGIALRTQPFPRRELAFEVARLLGEGINWTVDAEYLAADRQIALSVRAAYADALVSRPA
jgi:hypothetical protein